MNLFIISKKLLEQELMISKPALLSVAALLLLSSLGQAADTYIIDPAHTSITFSVQHLGISNVKGRFMDFDGVIVLDDGVIKEASGTIQVKSVETGVAQRDAHLRTADFFDVTNFPTITFKTKSVKKNRVVYRRHNLWDGRITMIADFGMHGVTRQLTLPASQKGPTRDPWGNIRIGLVAKAKLNRKDYGIIFNQVLESGVRLVGEEVELEINAEAIKATVAEAKKP
jgi:polyisoprenoid-binding protein YceI